MQVYAGIDEAGYGPLFGPLLVGRAVFGIEGPGPVSEARRSSGPQVPDLWNLLSKGVCRRLARNRARVAVNDSKKLHSRAAGIRHLERGVLAFAGLAGHQPITVDRFLDCMGETCHHDLGQLPWYAPTQERPWEPLPRACTIGEVLVDRSMLQGVARDAGVRVLDMGAAVVLEDRFNRMVEATRSKASTSFTFVAAHLLHIWDRFGAHGPCVVVDHQSSRTRYRELLGMTFPNAQLRVLDETGSQSSYHLAFEAGGQRRHMTVWFEVEADSHHLPAALASMVSKYTRELFMHRFQAWFSQRAPQVKPTAGYATDARRFWDQIEPLLRQWQIDPGRLRRMA